MRDEEVAKVRSLRGGRSWSVESRLYDVCTRTIEMFLTVLLDRSLVM